MNQRAKKFGIPALAFALGMATMLIFTAVPGCEDTNLTDEGITGSFEVEAIPILPSGFPLYPKSLASGNTDDIEDQIEDIVDEITDIGFIDIPNSVTKPFEQVLEWVFNERHPLYDPGPLSVAINQQLASIFKNTIEITEASLEISITNDTDNFWGVPINLSLYLGDAENVYAKSLEGRAAALVRTDETETCDCTMTLEPGETKKITTENLEGLVAALNDLHSVAIDYDADIQLADVNKNDYIDLFESNVSNVSKWRMSVGDFKLNLSGEGSLEFDDLYDWLDNYL